MFDPRIAHPEPPLKKQFLTGFWQFMSSSVCVARSGLMRRPVVASPASTSGNKQREHLDGDAGVSASPRAAGLMMPLWRKRNSPCPSSSGGRNSTPCSEPWLVPSAPHLPTGDPAAPDPGASNLA